MILTKQFTPRINIKKSRISNEFLFVVYFWGFTLLKPLLNVFLDKSTFILLVFAVIIMSLSLVKILFAKRMNVKGYYLILGIVGVILIDQMIRPNSKTLQYLYEFTIYGVIPIHLFSQIKNPEELLRIYSKVSVLAFFMFFLDPFFDYHFLSDYMTFGFYFALPAYIGLFIGRKFLNFKWMWTLELICLIELILFANRSAFLSILVFWILVEIIYERKKKKLILLFIILGSILFFIQDILKFVISLLLENGLYSYSLRHMQIYLMESNWTGMFSGRFEIWNQANNMIQENVLFGSGTGSFQDRYASYSHNLYLDIMVQYGLLGIFAFVSLLLKSIRFVHNARNYELLLGIALFSLWFPKLFFSVYFYRDIAIWCFLVLGLLKNKHSIKGRVNSMDSMEVSYENFNR